LTKESIGLYQRKCCR